jgi:hypothetical protein
MGPSPLIQRIARCAQILIRCEAHHRHDDERVSAIPSIAVALKQLVPDR